MNVRVVCPDCQHVLVESASEYPNDLGNCPECESPHKQIEVEISDVLSLREEYEGTVVNQQGEITAERISRTDGNTEANVSADAGRPAHVTARRNQRVGNFEEEGIVAEGLAEARNAKRGTHYAVDEKEKEDSDYADRVLVSKMDNPERIDVQIRHLDEDVIARINPRKNGKAGEFEGERAALDLEASINKAITAKARVDAATKSRAILLLQIPAILGKLARREMQRMSFDLKGFKEVWIAPFREECFEVFLPLDDSTIRPVAYKLWEDGEHPWGDEQRFWYAAIEKIRGL